MKFVDLQIVPDGLFVVVYEPVRDRMNAEEEEVHMPKRIRIVRIPPGPLCEIVRAGMVGLEFELPTPEEAAAAAHSMNLRDASSVDGFIVSREEVAEVLDDAGHPVLASAYRPCHSVRYIRFPAEFCEVVE